MKEYIRVAGISQIQGLSIFNIRYEAGYIAKLPHGTPLNTLIIMLDGMVKCSMPGTDEMLLSADRITFFNKEQPRISHYLTDTHLISVHIDFKSSIFDYPRQFPISTMNDFSKNCLSHLSESVNGDIPTDNYAICSYIYGLISELTRISEPDVPYQFKAIHAAMLAIEQDFTSERLITDYAKDIKMSESSFRRAFTLYTGVAPAQYRLQLRLEYVKLLVTTGECNITEAASKAGFNSLPYMCRIFKKKYGISVSDYLRSVTYGKDFVK